MPSTDNMILANLNEIKHALSNPATATPVSTLVDNHTEQLQQINKILTNIIQQRMTPILSPTDTEKGTELTTPLRVQTIDNVEKNNSHNPTAPLRVLIVEDDQPEENNSQTNTQHHKPATKTSTPAKTFANSTCPAAQRKRRDNKSKRNNPARATIIHTATRKNRKIQLSPHLACTLAHYALHGNAMNPDTNQIAKYPELFRCSEGYLWIESCKDDFGRLCNGHGPNMKTGTETMKFIRVDQIPKGKFATYLRIVATYQPEKENPRRICFTVGGNLIHYPGKISTKAATVKIMINSILSTRGTKFTTFDLKDFYLNTPMNEYKYTRIPLAIIPESILDKYNLRPLIHEGHIYVEIQKGMYGLPQAGKIANNQLIKYLKPHRYIEWPITPGLWKHKTRDIQSCLVVNDFGIKYTKEEDILHLKTILEKNIKSAPTGWDPSTSV